MKNNPDIDASVYLQHISSTFRRFVLDTLLKLDGVENSQPIPISSTMSGVSKIPSFNEENVVSDVTPAKSGGSEALRILEGLKSRPKTYRGLSAPSLTTEEASNGVDNSSVSSSR